ncbi:hypothetical protein J6X13_00020, partial [Candidatus Saccharibacteria bacterium]|nr:hypothetical protein [Candidatus Saccharibacteria bacterium]
LPNSLISELKAMVKPTSAKRTTASIEKNAPLRLMCIFDLNIFPKCLCIYYIVLRLEGQGLANFYGLLGLRFTAMKRKKI